MLVEARTLLFRNTLIVLAIVSGLFFRLEHLEKKLIWHDEVGTRLFAAGLQVDEWTRVLYTGQVLDSEIVRTFHTLHQKGAIDILRGLAKDDPHHPPLYYFLAGIWVRVFGDDISTLRLLSALFSLLLLPAIYWLCMELFRSVRIAWTGTALIAVSPFFVLYAQEAREYTLWFVLIALSNAAFLRAIRLSLHGAVSSRRIFWAWALCTLFTGIGLYTSLATTTVILAQAVYILIRERFLISKITLMGAGALTAGVLLFVPWAVALLMRWEAFQVSMAWSKMIHIPNRSLLAILALNVSRPVIDFWPDYEGLISFLGVGLATVLITFAIAFLILRARLKTAGLVLSLIFVPIMIVLLPDLLFGGIRSVSARYFAPSLVGLIATLAFLYGAETKGSRAYFQNVAFYIALAVGFASCYHNAGRDVVWTKGISYNLPQVASFINESTSPLVVGNRERHHPGNLQALSYLLKQGTKMQLLATEEGYILPKQFTGIYLYSPTDQFRLALEKREQVRTRLLMEDLHLQLWVVEPIGLH